MGEGRARWAGYAGERKCVGVRMLMNRRPEFDYTFHNRNLAGVHAITFCVVVVVAVDEMSRWTVGYSERPRRGPFTTRGDADTARAWTPSVAWSAVTQLLILGPLTPSVAWSAVAQLLILGPMCSPEKIKTWMLFAAF